MRKASTKGSWLMLAVAISGLAATLVVNPQPAYAQEGCTSSPGNSCCFNCDTGAKETCSLTTCDMPNNRWP